MVEARALPRLWGGLVLNVSLAFGWLLIQPLDLSGHAKVSTIMTYFTTFILADPATTNMFSELAPLRRGRLRLRTIAGIVVVKNLSLMLLIGGPLVAATAAVALAMEPRRLLPMSVAGVALQVLIWMGMCSVAAALLPTARRPLLARWRCRRHWRQNAWWAVGQAVPLAGIWVLIPVDSNREVFPGVGIVHRHTPGGRQFATVLHAGAAVVDGAGLWLLGVGFATALIWRFGLRRRG